MAFGIKKLMKEFRDFVNGEIYGTPDEYSNARISADNFARQSRLVDFKLTSQGENGLRLLCRGPNGGDLSPEAPTIIFFHGRAGSAYATLEKRDAKLLMPKTEYARLNLIDELPKDANIIAVELDRLTNPGRASFTRQIDDLKSFLIKNNLTNSVHLIGESMGTTDVTLATSRFEKGEKVDVKGITIMTGMTDMTRTVAEGAIHKFNLPDSLLGFAKVVLATIKNDLGDNIANMKAAKAAGFNGYIHHCVSNEHVVGKAGEEARFIPLSGSQEKDKMWVDTYNQLDLSKALKEMFGGLYQRIALGTSHIGWGDKESIGVLQNVVEKIQERIANPLGEHAASLIPVEGRRLLQV